MSAGPTRETAVDGVDGGPGNDIISIYNKPASLDGIRCGPGTDTLFYDKKDQYFSDVKRPDCEKVYNRAP